MQMNQCKMHWILNKNLIFIIKIFIKNEQGKILLIFFTYFVLLEYIVSIKNKEV